MPKRTAVRLTKTLVEQTPLGTTSWDSEVAGFGVRVTRSGLKTFVFQFRSRDGQQGKMTLGRYPAMTVEQARQIARENRVIVYQGGNPSASRRQHREAATLRDMTVHYCEVYGPAQPLKPATIRDAKMLLQKYALPRFGSRKVASILQADVRAMTADANAKAGRYQANRLQAVLSKVFNLAIEAGHRTDNPCRALKKRPEDMRYSYMTEPQVRAFLTACDWYPDQNAADAIRLLLFTGARLQEVLKARWDQFDLEIGLWIKPSSHTKAKMVHRLELPSHVVAMLRRMEARATGDYLFPGRAPARPRTTLKRAWKKIEDKAGIGHFYRHDLRRTMASFMLSSGSDLSTVGNCLGHTQAQTTKRYAFLMEGVQRAGTERAVERMLGR